MNVYFPPELLRQLIDLADRKRLSRSSIVEAAVTSFLSPDGADRTEAACGIICVTVPFLA
jgi:metal-responsive CopG/Arc/MetJ family transcriptional regulator